MKNLIIAFLCVSLCNGSFVQEFEKLRFESKLNSGSDGKIWVLLVAGSNGYYNYRHQADICHSYQVVHNHGIPDEQIVVMMYDDIAQAEENPTPGIIINHPDGKDVYHGVPKDYTGEDVTPKNFLSILTGNAQAMQNVGSGKVIASGPNDHVFVYFADHGAPGLIAFPTKMLLKDDLNNAIMTMYKNNQYAQMVLYIEACESGSMFDNVLSSDINVYATTAANPQESSYACYYDDKRETYLGDRYSVSWLEDSDKENIETESLKTQYKMVKAETNTSHVQQYGDMTISSEIVGMFQGEDKSTVVSEPLRAIYDDVPSPDVPIHILRHKIAAAKTREEKHKYETLLKKEQETRRRIQWAASTVAAHVSDDPMVVITLTTDMPRLNDMECYKSAIAAFDSHCFDLDKYEYAYRQLYVLGNLCDAGYSINTIVDAIALVC